MDRNVASSMGSSWSSQTNWGGAASDIISCMYRVYLAVIKILWLRVLTIITDHSLKDYACFWTLSGFTAEQKGIIIHRILLKEKLITFTSSLTQIMMNICFVICCHYWDYFKGIVHPNSTILSFTHQMLHQTWMTINFVEHKRKCLLHIQT